jgi:lysine N6-hydroxylase
VGNVAGKRVVVVGGGQSGAEAFLNLISREGDAAPAAVSWVSRRENFLPMDDSPFTNEYFMPCHSDHFFSQDSEYRSSFVRRNILASDGVSERTLRAIYQRIYTLRLIEARPPVILLAPNRSVEGLSRAAGAWSLELQSFPGDRRESIATDKIVWATGFRKAATDFLAQLADRFEWEGDEIRIDNDFAAVWDGPPGRRIFLLNAARRQRGLPDPNLSLLAWRSQRVLERINGQPVSRPKAQPAFIPWSGDPLGPSKIAV